MTENGKPKKNDVFKEEAKIRLNERRVRDRRKRKPYQKKRVIVPAGIVIVLLICGIFSFFYSLKYQSTDDAFVEGRMVSIAPKVSGQIIKLYFDDNYRVKKGQLLAEIDSRDYENKVKELEGAIKEATANKSVNASDIDKSAATLAQADKSLDSAKSKLDFAQKDFNRYSALKKVGLCTKQQYDTSKTQLDVAKSEYNQAFDNTKAMSAMVNSSKSKKDASSANIEKLQAQLAQAKLNLSYTKIYAPQSGNISSKSVEEGNYVQIGQPITAIVSSKLWVVANFKETQLTHIRKGQPVIVRIDTYPGKDFLAKVDSIQKATGAKSSLFPPENAVGSYVKVVQRIPVKIVFDKDYSNYNITPGMSVEPRVKIK